MMEKDSLHRIVISLTSSEKRFFKIHSTRHTIGDGNKYLELFDAMDRMATYDETRLLERMKTVQDAQTLAKQKHHLKNLILNSMVIYHMSNGSENRITVLLQQVDFLYRKGLYAESLKLVLKAEKIADELEKYTFKMAVLDWKRRIKARQSEIGDVLITLNDRDESMALLREENAHMRMAFRIYRQVQQIGVVRSEVEREVMLDFINELQQGGNAPKSFYAEYYTLSAYGLAHSALNNKLEHRQILKTLLLLLEANPQQIQDWPASYISALNNLCNANLALGEYNENKGLIVKIKVLKTQFTKGSNLYSNALIDHLNHEVLVYFRTGVFQNATALMFSNEEEVMLCVDKVSVSNRLQLFYDFAHVFFMAGRFKDSLRWINRILTHENLSVRSDIIGFSKLMNLLLHFELKNDRLLESLQRFVKYDLMKKGRYYPIERAVLNILQALVENNPKEKDRVIRNALDKFGIMAQDPYESEALEYFDFVLWAKAKLAKRSMNEMYMEKLKENYVPISD